MRTHPGASALTSAENQRSAAWVRTTLVVTALALALSMAWVLQVTLRQADALARGREQQLATNGLRVRQLELQDKLSTETLWDDAVANLDLRWNAAWARANIVQWQTDTFQLIQVFNGADRAMLRYAAAEPFPVQAELPEPGKYGRTSHAWSAGAQAELARVEADLLSRIRRRERARGPFPRRQRPSQTVISQPIEESTAALVGGRLYLFTASLVQPDFGARLPHARAPIVIGAREVDAGYLRAMSEGLLLGDLALQPRDARLARGFARIPVKDAEGRVQAFLAWRPQRPAAGLVRSLAWPVAGAGLLLAAAVLVVGLSERRYRRHLHAARRNAEAASEAKSRFLANTSHEIRTPLNGIMGMAQLLSRSPLSVEQREHLEIILRSGSMLTTVLNDVLDLSKIEAGQLSLDPREFDLSDCVETACGAFAGLAREKGLAFEIEIASDALGCWLGDDGRIRQILSNLCSNAVKFTAAGGVLVRVGQSGGRLQVRVQDTGIGIPADKQEDMFREFSQADASTTRTYGGTGLGLAISRRLAGLMGGALTVESRLGEGSAFCLDVPIQRLREATSAPEAQTSAERLAPQGLRILAADDNEINRRILQSVLAPFCSELILVADGAEAVAAFKAGSFDLVLMDIQMPRQDGVVSTREIRAFEAAERRSRTPILALTANLMTEQLSDYALAGMDGHIGKPIDFPMLFEALNRVMGREAAQDDLREGRPRARGQT